MFFIISIQLKLKLKNEIVLNLINLQFVAVTNFSCTYTRQVMSRLVRELPLLLKRCQLLAKGFFSGSESNSSLFSIMYMYYLVLTK